MTTIELNTIQSGDVAAGAEPDGSQPRARSKDNGPSTLPHLEHLVHIIRKVQRPMLLRALLEAAHGQELPAVQAFWPPRPTNTAGHSTCIWNRGFRQQGRWKTASSMPNSASRCCGISRVKNTPAITVARKARSPGWTVRLKKI